MVADELPDWFIEKLRTAVEETKPEALLIGEVWEDASNKIAYSLRRRYLLGSELHGVMNYPFRTALLAYLQGGDADDFRESMESVRENYPPAAFYNSMNFLGTHDTPLHHDGAGCQPRSRKQRRPGRLSAFSGGADPGNGAGEAGGADPLLLPRFPHRLLRR